jgi:hypothetical protein
MAPHVSDVDTTFEYWQVPMRLQNAPQPAFAVLIAALMVEAIPIA